MNNKKYQVFVSSTFRDLLEERQDAIRNILDLKHIPAGMELFPATDKDQLEYIKKVIDECDYYLLIMGGRYGSMDEQGISYTEREYDYAVETGKFVIAFAHKNPSLIPYEKSEVDPLARESMGRFRVKVMSGRLVREWSSRQELEALVLKSLVHAFNDVPQVGWIRGDSAASNDLLEQNNHLLLENSSLKSKLSKMTEERPLSFEGLADLDDEFTVRYQYTNRRTSTVTYPNISVNLTWRQIFIGVGAQLDKAKTDISIKEGVAEAISEVGSQKLTFINDLDRVKIKVQLVALGLIETRVSKTTQGGVAEFLSLTSKGRALFYENMVVRKVDQSS